MCGRYKVSTPGDELWEAFDLHGEVWQPPARYNIAPSQPVLLVRTPHRLETMRWGLRFATGSKSNGINVRVESLGAPLYREAVRTRRCLILADGFYEWQIDAHKKKRPFLLQRSDKKPFAFAGIWSPTQLANGELVDACAILTTAARGVVAVVHHRMPVILPRAHEHAWLTAARYDDLLVPDVSDLQAYPVSALVNSPANDDARLIEPVAPPEA